MTVLEFIRRNQILVLVAIVGVGAGLIMMDYSNKSFGKDFYVQVDGSSYDYQETYNLGENGNQYLGSLLRRIGERYSVYTSKFDTNLNGQIDQEEAAAMDAWLSQNPDTYAKLSALDKANEKLRAIYQSWNYGASEDEFVNTAINRAILQAEGKRLGLTPSPAQIDEYIRNMAAFQKEDGTFDNQMYQDLTGYNDGVGNSAREKVFRSVISDIMVWESINSMLARNLSYSAQIQETLADSALQKIHGKVATLTEDKVQAPAEPTEDEIKAYWEGHKDSYLSTERRIISVYTMTPTEADADDTFLYTAEGVMDKLVSAKCKGMDAIFEAATTNEEYSAFTYKAEDGSTHKTYEICTLAELPEGLKELVNCDGKIQTVGETAFAKITEGASLADYEAAVKAGTPENTNSVQQLCGPYKVEDSSKYIFILVNAIDAPTPLPFEQARDKALVDLKAERAANALQLAAEKLHQDMTAALEQGGIDAAFAKATEAGATVEDFAGELGGQEGLPSGVSTAAMRQTKTGKLAPLAVDGTQAVIAGISDRTVEDSPTMAGLRTGYIIPMFTQTLRSNVLLDWQNSSYGRYQVQYSEHVRRRK